MLNRLRTNRSITRFFAVALFVASVHPFVLHACLMADAPDRPLPAPCHCENASGVHEGMADMPAAPCENQDTHPAGDHGKTPSDDCCPVACGVFSTKTATSPKATTHELNSLALVILPRDLIDTYPPIRARQFKDLSPPPLSASHLYILFARLLN